MASGKETKQMHSMARDALCDVFNAKDRASRDRINAGDMFYVDTDVGLLRGKLFAPTQYSARKWGHGWVYFCFMDTAKAKTVFESGTGYRLNPHSGKWNWMLGDGSLLSNMVDGLARVNPRNFRFTI